MGQDEDRGMFGKEQLARVGGREVEVGVCPAVTNQFAGDVAESCDKHSMFAREQICEVSGEESGIFGIEDERRDRNIEYVRGVNHCIRFYGLCV